jgi:predicted RNA-binding protein associated with RNAse of E/G family
VSVGPRRRPGDVVALREIVDGRVWSARPAIVVRDEPEQVVTFTPAGVAIPAAVDAGGQELRIPSAAWTLAPSRGRWNVLGFSWPGERAAVLAMWDPGWAFRMWYVNVEDPLRPTPIGFDTSELVLDVVVEPDLRAWRWKDEDELEEAVELGVFTRDDAESFRRAADRGRRRVMEREPPFDVDWTAWRPDPRWPTLPDLPEGWDR